MPNKDRSINTLLLSKILKFHIRKNKIIFDRIYETAKERHIHKLFL